MSGIGQGHRGWQGPQALSLVWILQNRKPSSGTPLMWPCLPNFGHGGPYKYAKLLHSFVSMYLYVFQYLRIKFLYQYNKLLLNFS
jgi:hypothetical protein